MVDRNRTLALVVMLTLGLAGCGDDASKDTASTPTPTPTPTATASASPEATPASTPPRGKCHEVKLTKPAEPSNWTHPNSNFYAPGDSGIPTATDLDHLLVADNAVVVTYGAKTPKKTRERLYDWTFKDVVKRTPVVVPDSSPDALPVRARIATVELRCARFDFKRLTAFANRTDIAPLPRTEG
jgi:hypothetical protein